MTRVEREYIAFNRRLPIDVQCKLAKDEDFYVRKALAKNPNIELAAQRILAKDKHEIVRYCLAKNKSLSPRIYKLLSKDPYDPTLRVIKMKMVIWYDAITKELLYDEWKTSYRIW